MYFDPKHFWIQLFVWPKYWWTQMILHPQSFWTVGFFNQKFLELEIFWDPKWDPKFFLDPNFLELRFFMALKLCRPNFFCYPLLSFHLQISLAQLASPGVALLARLVSPLFPIFLLIKQINDTTCMSVIKW